MLILTKAFWIYAAERATKTVVQSLLASLLVGGVTGILAVAWLPALSTVALAGLISVLTSYLGYTPAIAAPVAPVVAE